MGLFELPRPGELGEGWSLRFLTAEQMLECRTEGEARAGEERDKALWANAALLARVLLKEGEPAFASGEEVLASLTVGQMDNLVRRWWAQDDFSGRVAQDSREILREDGTDRERSENEHFDMARFLALGGTAESPARDFAGEGTVPAGAVGLSAFPAVWPGRSMFPEIPGAVQGAYRGLYEANMPRGTAILPGDGALTMEGADLPARKEVGGGESAPEEYSTVKVVLPESVQAEPGLTVEELDRAVERDARRYDGGLTLL